MKVEVRNYYRDPQNGELDETWTLDQDGMAVCDDPSMQESMEMHGVIGKGGLWYPKDGEAFLRSLPYQYANSSFIRAVVIE